MRLTQFSLLCLKNIFFSVTVCQWISALSIFCGPCRFPVWACWDYRTTCFKAGNDCVYHRIGDNKFIVLIPNIITCHLHRTRDFFLSSFEAKNWNQKTGAVFKLIELFTKLYHQCESAISNGTMLIDFLFTHTWRNMFTCFGLMRVSIHGAYTPEPTGRSVLTPDVCSERSGAMLIWYPPTSLGIFCRDKCWYNLIRQFFSKSLVY